jgi:Rrf2 family transcriptional regulator, nitric oxide-sensitive transcriptional repressor
VVDWQAKADILYKQIFLSLYQGAAMLSQTAEYALRATVHLGEQDGSPRTVQQIADAIQAPSGYLAKVLQAMTKAGIVKSRRGLHGGFILASSPESISVYDVLQAVDPIKRFRSCPLNIADHKDLCPLHRQLDNALALIEGAFKKATIATLLDEGAASSLCSGECQNKIGKASRESPPSSASHCCQSNGGVR